MTHAVVIQARMSSRRLPGKTLLPVKGKPLLQYVVERVEQAVDRSRIVVATSDHPEDTPVQKFCDGLGVACHRGPLDDVAGRFNEVIERFKLDSFVRVCGDSPLIDAALIRQSMALYASGDYDVVSNVVVRTFPKGQSVEMVRSAAFVNAYAQMKDSKEKEHATAYFYEHAKAFRIASFRADEDFSQTQLSVDTREDFDLFQSLISHMTNPHWTYGWKDVLNLANQLEQKAS